MRRGVSGEPQAVKRTTARLVAARETGIDLNIATLDVSCATYSRTELCPTDFAAAAAARIAPQPWPRNSWQAGSARGLGCATPTAGPRLTGVPARSDGLARGWPNRPRAGVGKPINPGVEPAVQSPGSMRGVGPQPSLDVYLPPSALQLGVSREGKPMARKASGAMPSVWVTLSTRPTILFDRLPSALAVTSLIKTEPVA